MRFITIFLSTLLLLPVSAAQAREISVASPDGKLQVTVFERASRPYYRVDFDGKPLLRESRLGLEFRDIPNLTETIEVAEVSRNQIESRWEQPWGEQRRIHDHHNELLVSLTRTEAPKLELNVRFRVFDDGIGFRYEMPAQRGLTRANVVGDMSEFGFADAADIEALHIDGQNRDRYELVYRSVPLESVHTAATPITFRRSDGVHASIHEAALVDWAGFTLVQRHNPKTLRAQLTPWSDGIAVKATLPFKSSWRTLQVADSAVGLLNSHLILNLNEPNQLGDVSWVNPGKYTGVWWEMHRQEYTWGSGDKHGATNERVKARIDFAADYGFDGVLVEGWNVGWDGNWIDNEGVDFSFTETYADFDMPMLSAYGAERGVKIIGHHETSGNVALYEDKLEDALDYYAGHGVEQIKTGYVAWAKGLRRVDEKGFSRYEWHDGQWSANHHLRVIKEAAERKIAINAHEPIKDTGLRRTYPNWISREGARGMEYNSVGAGAGVNPPDHDVTLVYTRMLSGPMDFTPGVFDLLYPDLDTPARVKSTLVHQLALYVVLYSPIQMVPDYRQFYERYPDAFQFIRDVPTDWEQSIALQGVMADHVVFARQERDSSDWYLGAITGNEARKLDVPLDFLDAGVSYTAQIYRDGKSAHWDDAPYDYVIEEKRVDAGDVLKVRVAAGGGLAVRFIRN